MEGQSNTPFPMLLRQRGTRFYHRDFNGGIPVEYMSGLLPFYADLAGTLAVTPGQIVYVKLCGDLGWAIAAWWLLAHVQGHEWHLLPSDALAENAGGGLHARLLPAENVKGRACGPGMEGAINRFEPGYEGAGRLQLETLSQHDFLNHPRAQAPRMKLNVSYDCVSLSSALAGCGVPSLDGPIFAADAPIGVKMSICLWIEGVRSPRPLEDGFSSKQYRVRTGDEKFGRPITRARLAHIIAVEVFDFMRRHTVEHNGEVVVFEQLYLKTASLKSKATIQPVLCIRPSSTAGISGTLRSVQHQAI
ncbi:hypothetical protein VTO73DRAFT_7330 [Trametes versicolor]